MIQRGRFKKVKKIEDYSKTFWNSLLFSINILYNNKNLL